MATQRCYYEVLGVERTATVEEIKRSYRSLAMKYHPDRNGGDAEAEERFKEVSAAYQILSDGEKRERYDRYGHAGLQGGGGPDFGAGGQSPFDLFGDLLGDFFGGGGRRGGPQPGRSIQVVVDLDLVEAYRGCKKTITIPREEGCTECGGSGARKGTRPAQCQRCGGRGQVVMQQGIFRMQRPCSACGGRGQVVPDPCPTCRGNGRVQVQRTLEIGIPPGVDTGVKVRHPGEGEAGAPGMPRGDLLIAIRVKEHSLFHRDGNHLVCQVPVTYSQAALGAEVEVPTLDGKVNTPLARGTQSGEVLRIPGKGMPDVHGGRRGDLIVQVLVETPKTLTKRQEELLRELAELDHKHVQPERKSFLDKLKNFFSGEGERET